jgi:hypothetical protein
MTDSLSRNPKRIIIPILIISIPLFLFVAINVVSKVDYRNSDFFSFWLAGRMTWLHQNPYSVEQWVNAHHQFGATWISDPFFLYPLPLAIIFAPLGLLSLDSAYIVWIFVSQLFILFSIFSLVLSQKVRKWEHLIIPVIVGTFLFRPTLVTLRNGQLGAFLLLILSLTIVLWDHHKWWQGCIVLSLASLKPTIGLPILGFIGFWLLTQRKFGAILSIILTEFAIYAIGRLLNPQWLYKYVSIGNQKLLSTFGYSPTVWGLGGLVCNHVRLCTLGIGIIVSLLLTIGVFWFLLKNKNSCTPAMIFSLIIPLVVSITPYIWAYDQLILIVPISAISIAMLRQNYPYVLAAVTPILVTFLSLVLLYLATILRHDIWGIFVPILSLSLVFLLYSKRLNPRNSVAGGKSAQGA